MSERGGTSPVTTAPAAMSERSPTVSFSMMVEPIPTKQPVPTRVKPETLAPGPK